jgi:chromosome segregation ATPase
MRTLNQPLPCNLTAVQIQATSKGQEAKVLCKKLATVHTSITSLRAELAQAQQEVVQLRQQVQLLESVSIKSPAAVATAESKVRVLQHTMHCTASQLLSTTINLPELLSSRCKYHCLCKWKSKQIAL